MNASLTLVAAIALLAATQTPAPQDGRGQVRRLAAEAEPAQPPPQGRLSAAPAQTVDSVAEDLQKIVVLCATKPGSADFSRAWSRYVGEHVGKDDDVDALIESVIERAAAWQAENGASKNARARISGRLSPQTRQSMHDSARAIIRNVKG